MSLKLDRKIYVTVGPLDDPLGRKFQNLRMHINLTKTNDTTKNTGSVEIYNLKHSTMQDIVNYKGRLGVTVEAGYANRVGIVFLGTTTGVHVKIDKADKILVLEIADGIYRAQNVWFTASYSKPAELLMIFEDILKAMREVNPLLVLATVPISIAFGAKPYKNGFTWNGYAGDCLTRICVDRNLHWFIDDNALHILEQEQKIWTGMVPLLSADSGLIGSPEYFEDTAGERKDKHIERGLKFRCLLDPDIKVGSEVKVVSKYFNNNYLVREININADSKEGDFIMDIVGINEWI